MRNTFAALFTALAAGCASTSPAWLNEPHQVVPIRWIRVQDPPQMEVRDGACVLYLQDTTGLNRLDRLAAEPLVQRCIERGGLVAGAGDFDLHWHQVDDAQAMQERTASLHPRSARAASPVSLLRPGTTARRGETAGVYRRDGGACLVVTRRGWPTLAHELRHCYEGDWHRP